MSITRPVAAAESPPSVEQVRKQAKRRLIGVAVLVLAAVIVFPLLFDTQPRPVPVDMPIEIPSRKVAKPLQVDSPAVAETSASEPSATPPGLPAAADGKEASGAAKSAAEPEEVIIASTPARKPSLGEVKPTAAGAAPAVQLAPKDASASEPAEKKAVPAPAKPAAEKAAPAAQASPPAAAPPAPRKTPDADAARAQALLEGKPVPAAATAPAAADAGSTRYIVQVGAFADQAVAQATREKLERAGLKTYTHVAQLPEGKRTRVRLGPFATKADAEKAATKAKAQGLPAAILTL